MLFDNIFDVNSIQICLIMDFSHVVKKIRNNTTKSGTLTTKIRTEIHCVGKLIQGISMGLLL